jgi:hypothetical protein
MRGRALVSLITMTAFTACQAYVPLSSPIPKTGTPAKVVLTDQGAIDIAKDIGPRATAVKGRVVSGGGDADLVLNVTSIERRNGQEEFWQGESVTIPRNAIATVAEQKISRTRTVLAVAGGAALAAAISTAFSGSGFLGRGSKPPGQKQ